MAKKKAVVEKSEFFERIKALYDKGRIANLKVFVQNGMITPEEYSEICGEPYED